MNKERSFGELLIQGLQDAVAFERGELPARTKTVQRLQRDTQVDTPPDYDAERVQAMRRQMALSQRLFARTLNVSLQTVRAWEQGTRQPDGASRRLLELAEEHPDLLVSKVHA